MMKLIQTGMRLLVKHDAEIKAIRAETKEVVRMQKLFLEMHGSNGKGHTPIQ